MEDPTAAPRCREPGRTGLWFLLKPPSTPLQHVFRPGFRGPPDVLGCHLLRQVSAAGLLVRAGMGFRLGTTGLHSFDHPRSVLFLLARRSQSDHTTQRVLTLLSLVLQHVGLVSTPSSNPVSLVSSIGVVIAHVCHLASCFVLYQLGLLIWDEKTWALAAALLHVFSPAGLFLSAPYAESPHSLLAFVGWLLLARSCTRPRSHGALAPATSHLLTLLSGIVFGLATVLRSNGLLNGLPFACDFLVTFYCLVEDPELSRTPAYLIKLGVVGLSGLFVAAGYAGPQVWAYKTYCSGSLAQPRPWCRDLLPSIYSYVQRQYW